MRLSHSKFPSRKNRNSVGIISANNLSRTETSANGITFSGSVASLVLATLLFLILLLFLVNKVASIQVSYLTSQNTHIELVASGHLTGWFLLAASILAAFTASWFLWNREAQRLVGWLVGWLVPRSPP